MKTRDDLAEAIFLASVATDPSTRQTGSMSTKAAFDRADEFVAERERRAAAIPLASGAVTGDELGQAAAFADAQARATPVAPHDPDKGCVDCENHEETPTFKEHFCRTDGGKRVSLLPHFKTARNEPAPSWCPKRAPAETAALKFSDSGLLLDANGDVADEDNDGYSAMAYGYAAAVTIRATDRAQSERKVAAMLKVGRETK